MRWKRGGLVVFLGCVLSASLLAPIHVQGAGSGAVLESVAFEASPEGGGIRLRTSGPLEAFTCTLPKQGSRDLVIDLRGASTSLPARLDLNNPVVPQASIEPVAGGGAGMRVHLSIGLGALLGIEQSDHGLLIRFASAPSPQAGSPQDGPPGAGEYQVGVGDKLEIGVLGHDDLAKIVEVRSDGTINYPLIGDIRAAGKSVAEIDAEITRVLGADYLVDPQVSVDVREYQSQWVTIIGEVRTPGRYVLKRDMRVIDVLAEAGGVTKEAGSRILLTRKSAAGAPQQIALDRNRLLSQENDEANILLQHNDILAVAERDLFYIRGEVTRPGPYQFEGGLTILRAISYAGGFTQFANRKQVDILRSGENGVQQKHTVNLKAIEEGKKEDIPLLPGDTVIVPRRIF